MVNNMPTDEQIRDEMPHLEKIAKAQDIEIAEAIKVFADAVAKIEEMPKMTGKSWKIITNRAYSLMDQHFNNRKKPGETFIVVPFGPLGDTKDWNDDEFKTIEQEVLRPGGINKLLKDGKLMTITKTVDGVETEVPISKIINYKIDQRFVKGTVISKEKVDDSVEIGLYRVVEAEEWKKGEGQPIFRDSRLYNNNFVNKDFTRPLRHRWEFTLVGLAWPKENAEDARLFETKVRYEQADPESDKFFFKHHQMFKAYTDNFETGPKSTNWKYILTTPYLSLKAAEYDSSDIDINIAELFAFLNEKFDVEAVKKGDELPIFIQGIVGIEDFHRKAVKMEGNRVLKSKTGWDVMKWNKYAIISCSMQSMKEPSGNMKFPSYTIFDSEVNKRMNVFSTRYIYNQPQLPGQVLMLVRTSRRPERYDPSTRTNIADPINGDISLTAYSLAVIGNQVKIEDIKMDGVDV
jgi:hypothetical protein